MLKCHLDHKTDTCEITVEGNLFTIFTDVTYLIHDIYLACRNNSPIMGDVFQNALRRFVNYDSSPIWEVSDTYEAGEDGIKDVSVRLPKALQDLQDLLDDLRGSEHGE